MPRYRSRTPLTSTVISKRNPRPGLLTTQLSPHQAEELTSAKAWKAMLTDLGFAMLVGPSDKFLMKPSTATGLFGLALERLAEHDKTMADALRRYAGMFGRTDLLDLRTSTEGLKPIPNVIATLDWLMSEPIMCSVDDMPNYFDEYRRASGKRTCYPRTLRRQAQLLHTYGSAYNYPARSRLNQRPAWIREHLMAMIAEAQKVACWHPWRDLTDQDRENVMINVKSHGSLAKLSALVLTQLHPISEDYLLKRLLPRRH